jgi:hypothetical protein
MRGSVRYRIRQQAAKLFMMDGGESMKRTGRVLATLFLGVMFGIFRHYQQMRMLDQGRDGYLAEQSQYFDRILRLHSAAFTLIAGIILAVVAVGLYELIATGFTHVLPAGRVEE